MFCDIHQNRHRVSPQLAAGVCYCEVSSKMRCRRVLVDYFSERMRLKSIVYMTAVGLVLLLSGCREKELSAREVMEQVCSNMEDLSECTFTAGVEIVMSVYGETLRLEAQSQVQASFSSGKAMESVKLYRDQICTGEFTYGRDEQAELSAFRAATDMKRFLNKTEVFFVEGEEDSETIYTIEGLADSSSLGGMEDMEKMAAFLPVLEPADWETWVQGYSFPIRVKVDRETLMPVEVAVNISEAVKDPVRESICALGIPGAQVQTGSCVITYRYETFGAENGDT